MADRRTARHMPSLADLPELMTADEAAAWLGVGRNTIYELIRRGAVASVRLGRLVRVPRAALAEMMAARR